MLLIPSVNQPVIHRQKEGIHLLLHPQKPYWLTINNLGYPSSISKCNTKRDLWDLGQVRKGLTGQED